VRDVQVTLQDVHHPRRHESGQRLTGYVGKPEVMGHSAFWGRLLPACPSTVCGRTSVPLSSEFRSCFWNRVNERPSLGVERFSGGNRGLCNVEPGHCFLSDLDLLYHLHLQPGIGDLQLQSAGFSRLILKVKGFAG
jgi:hypothetical protein